MQWRWTEQYNNNRSNRRNSPFRALEEEERPPPPPPPPLTTSSSQVVAPGRTQGGGGGGLSRRALFQGRSSLLFPTIALPKRGGGEGLWRRGESLDRKKERRALPSLYSKAKAPEIAMVLFLWQQQHPTTTIVDSGKSLFSSSVAAWSFLSRTPSIK